MAEKVVVDASAIAAVLFGEPDGPALVERLHGTELVAPTLLPYEIASVCLKKMRRHPARRDALHAAFVMFGQLGISTVPVDHDEALLLAGQTGLSAYDASYLWLARRLGSDLVTLDRLLQKASLAEP